MSLGEFLEVEFPPGKQVFNWAQKAVNSLRKECLTRVETLTSPIAH